MSPDGSDKRVPALNGNPLRPAQNQAWDPAYDAPTPTPSPAPNPATACAFPDAAMICDDEADRSPHPFDIMALEALYQTVNP